MKANDLRINNQVYYHIEDTMDERKEWDEVDEVDAMDLVHLSKHPDDPNYKFIPLTEEWLIKFGFTKGSFKNCYYKTWGENGVEDVVYEYHYKGGYEYELGPNRYKSIEYVHQLQNLFWCITGTELTIK